MIHNGTCRAFVPAILIRIRNAGFRVAITVATGTAVSGKERWSKSQVKTSWAKRQQRGKTCQQVKQRFHCQGLPRCYKKNIRAVRYPSNRHISCTGPCCEHEIELLGLDMFGFYRYLLTCHNNNNFLNSTGQQLLQVSFHLGHLVR